MSKSCDITRLRTAPGGPPLRVGILLDGRRTESWAASAVELLCKSPYLVVVNAFIKSPGPQQGVANGASCLFRLYDGWRTSEGQFLQAVDVSLTVPALKMVELEGQWELTARDVARIEEQSLDVLIHLGRSRLVGDCSRLAHSGVFSFRFGSPGRELQHPPYFWEIYDQEAVCSVCLLHHAERFERAQVIQRHEGATRQGWFYRKNQAEPFSMAGRMIERQLIDLQHDPQALARPSVGEEMEIGETRGSGPNSAQTAKFLMRQAVRSVRVRLEARGRSTAWFMALREPKPGSSIENVPFSPAGFTEIRHPKQNECADPFLIGWQGRNFVFFEEVVPDTGRGRISAMEITKPGEYSEPFVVLEKPYHLSYPFLIPIGSEIFLIPESSGNETVELYRAERFPEVWRKEKILVKGAALVDTTPFYHQGRWYFFTTAVDRAQHSCYQAFLFHSDRLDGDWTWHPKNPICADVRRARSAGAIFRRQGKLIRPAQDCSVRYGYAVVLNEIVRLSPSEYEERPVERIAPNWAKGLLGTHTLNRSERYEAIDGLRFV